MESNEAPGTPQETSTGIRRHIPAIVAVVVVLGVAGGVWGWLGFGSYFAQRWEYANRTETFSGNSESLKQTVIVPTLDTPCPPNKNVIWCSSFQLAWNEVRDKVIGAPLEVVGAEEVAARLNAARQSSSDLEPRSFYAAGGRTKDGIVKSIRKGMAAKFPSHVPPDFGIADGGILAYSYLMASVPFEHPFEQTELAFGDSRGKATEVEAFGVWNVLWQYNRIREQVEILYCRLGRESHRRIEECAIDLCKDSRPYQVVVAMVERRGSLAETLEYTRLCVSDFQKSGGHEDENRLGRVDHLKVPEMLWKVDHRFGDLIGKLVANANPAMPIVEAMQTIEFRLDQYGAVLESETRLGVTALPREFVFNRPFLVYMQKRGAEHPFFVMWVDNAELLTRK